MVSTLVISLSLSLSLSFFSTGDLTPCVSQQYYCFSSTRSSSPSLSLSLSASTENHHLCLFHFRRKRDAAIEDEHHQVYRLNVFVTYYKKIATLPPHLLLLLLLLHLLLHCAPFQPHEHSSIAFIDDEMRRKNSERGREKKIIYKYRQRQLNVFEIIMALFVFFKYYTCLHRGRERERMLHTRLLVKGRLEETRRSER